MASRAARGTVAHVSLCSTAMQHPLASHAGTYLEAVVSEVQLWDPRRRARATLADVQAACTTRQACMQQAGNGHDGVSE